MNRLLPVGLLAAAMFLGACQDSTEIDKLRSDMVAQRSESDALAKQRDEEVVAMKRRIAELEGRLGGLQDGDNARPVSEQLAAMEAQLTEIKSAGASDSDARIEALEKRITDMKQEVVEAAVAEAMKAGAGEVDPEKLAAALAKEQAANAPTKDLAQALERLQISQSEKELIRQHIIDAKSQILETLEIPSADGRVYAEELIDVFIKVSQGKATEADAHKLFGELMTKKVPGDIHDRTYMEAINAIKEENKGHIGRILSAEDQKKLTAAHGDWTDFEVGDGDPWGALYMERLQKQEE